MSGLRYTPLDEITAIHATLKNEYRSGKTKSIAFRRQQLVQLFYMIYDNKKQFCDAFEADLGRSGFESILLEIANSLISIRLAYDHVQNWSKPERAPYFYSLGFFNFPLSKPIIRKESKGLVAVMVPFNYPLLLAMWNVTGAIAAGNAVVLKPSELSPNISALYEELFAKYMDPSLYRIVNGGVVETTHLLTLQWDHISYTGNGRVGRIIAAAAAKHLTPITLEMGGKSPVFVDPNCDMRTAARRILWGKYCNAGMTCIAPDHVLIPENGLDKFIDALKTVYGEFYPEGPAKSKDFARIVNDAHFRRIKSLLDNTNGTIVLGGEMDAADKYIAPTVVKDVHSDDSLMSEEIFGPILPIIAVKNLEEAFDIVNSRDHALTLHVFSQSSEFKQKVADNTHSGTIVFNETMLQATAPVLPFGGTGPSGYGGYSVGKYSFNTFTHYRGTMDNPKWIDIILELRMPPYTSFKQKWLPYLMTPRLPPRRPWTLWGFLKRIGRWFLR